MRILIKQFLSQNHSWAVVGRNLATSLIDMGHQVDLFPTDGIDGLPDSLRSHVVGYYNPDTNIAIGNNPKNDYDTAISYTAMKNFGPYLSHGRNKLGIWCYEFVGVNGSNVFPTGFAKNHNHCDFICAPSNFAKRGFVEAGVPEKKVVVIPHGVDKSFIEGNSIVDLGTKKRFKLLVNIAQNHKRKNIPGLLDMYGKAFSNKDDVVLILKAKHKTVNNKFDVSLQDCLNDFYRKYPKHAEIKLLTTFIDDMSSLYRSVDALFSPSFCEGFLMPSLEAISCGKLVIASNYGAQLDFLDDSNALLIDGKEGRADPNSMYWEQKNNAVWFIPSIDDGIEKLRFAYNNFESMNERIAKNRVDVYKTYSWNTIAAQFLELCK